MINIKVDTRKVERQFRNISSKFSKLVDEAYGEFVKNTPKLSGNARNKTRKTGNNIRAGYNYADKLDRGYSKKAPQGMTKPTVEFIKKRIERILKENR